MGYKHHCLECARICRIAGGKATSSMFELLGKYPFVIVIIVCFVFSVAVAFYSGCGISHFQLQLFCIVADICYYVLCT